MFLLRQCWVVLCLCVYALTGGQAWAAQRPEVWVALTESGGSYLEVAEALRAETDRRSTRSLEWVIAPASEFLTREGTPVAVLTVGASAWRELAARFVTAPPLMLATLLPRDAFEQGLPWKTRPRQVSAVLLDQPLARQINLLKQLSKQRKLGTVGLLLGPASKRHAGEYQSALAAAGLTPFLTEVSDTGEVAAALRNTLTESDVLLAVPDPVVFNSQTISAILLGSYRRLVPLVGYSSSLVKSGALVALYATPAQVGQSAADVLLDALAGRTMPPPRPPAEFNVAINSSVAKSLGLLLGEAELQRTLMALESGPGDRLSDRESAP